MFSILVSGRAAYITCSIDLPTGPLPLPDDQAKGANAKVVGANETGSKVNGDKHWFWVCQTSFLTYITHSDNRGKATVDGHCRRTLSDMPASFVETLELSPKYQGTSWGVKLKELLYHAMEVRDKGHGKDQGYVPPRAEIV